MDVVYSTHPERPACKVVSQFKVFRDQENGEEKY